ncbi:2-amino-4-hydroxy-6-hydroxymethyldihydropteridine diphosphokinase [Chloroflexota bacterium]
MTTEPVTVYLSLGSNMGDRQRNLDKALELLAQRLRLGPVSSIFETDPLGDSDQPRFLNLVCRAQTRLAPENVLALAKGIEKKLGRTGKSGAPRPIDIDILLYGQDIIDSPELVVPHPKMASRAFVLVPLAEIDPAVKHPASGLTSREMLAAITEKQGVLKWDND